MTDESNLYWIWLSQRVGIASKEFIAIAEKFEDPYDVYRLDGDELSQFAEISGRMRDRLIDKSLDDAYILLKYCKKNKIDVIGFWDKRYPSRLRDIENPPVLLYCMGDLPDLNSRLCIGMVGTRKMSEYGKQSAYKIAYELASADVCVVSGMALGVDGVCAAAALEAGGQTVAVLGCGFPVVYPKEHTRLMKAIADGGAVISEYPPFERPAGQNFPKRNRIISGICQGVLVVEAAHGSGALITASRAISQGRELFAMPGKIDDENSYGPNELIQSGANVVLSSDDIISHFDFMYHDVINYGKLNVARRREHEVGKVLKKYKVSWKMSRAAREEMLDRETECDAKELEASAPKVPYEQVRRDGVSARDAYEHEKLNKAREEAVGDNPEKVFDTLDATTQKIFKLLPDAKAVTPDELVAHGVSIGDVVTSLTILEISGLVTSLPGGMYVKS